MIIKSIQIEFFCILVDREQNIVSWDFELIFFLKIIEQTYQFLGGFCISCYFSAFGLAIQPNNLPNFRLILKILDILGGDGLGDDNFNDFVSADEGHFLFEGAYGWKGIDFKILAEWFDGCGGCGGDKIVRNYLAIFKGHF